jgi:hypothetical protein
VVGALPAPSIASPYLFSACSISANSIWASGVREPFATQAREVVFVCQPEAFLHRPVVVGEDGCFGSAQLLPDV